MEKKILIKALSEASKIMNTLKAQPEIMRYAILSFDGNRATLLAADFDRKVCAWFDLGCDLTPSATYAIEPRSAGKALKAMPDVVQIDRFLSLTDTHVCTLADAVFIAASIGPAYLASRMRRTPCEAEPLRRLISKTSFAISDDETREHLNGAWLESSGGGMVRMVATDGHRLAKCNVEWPVIPVFAMRASPADAVRSGILIPAAGIEALDRMLTSRRDVICIAIAKERFAARRPTDHEIRNNVTTFPIVRDPQHLVIEVGNAILAILLSTAEFPPYEQVIPSRFERVFDVDRALLLASLDRAKIAASPKTFGCRLKMSDGRLDIETDNGSGKAYAETLPIRGTMPDFSIGVNARYLLEPLREMTSETVRLSSNGVLDPLMLSSFYDECVNVTMPMRL